MYKGVIFDLDGTLLNTLYDLSDSVNSVLASYGYPQHEYESYKQKIGKGMRNLIKVSLPESARNEENISEAVNKFMEAYAKNYMNKTVPYDNITETVQILQENGIKIGVNTNKKSEYAVNLMHKFFPDISFSGIFGEIQGIPKKPDPAGALKIAEIMELSPKEIIYIGDSGIDIQTGKNAGMGTAGVLWGFRGKEEFIANNADYIIENPKQILNIFNLQ